MQVFFNKYRVYIDWFLCNPLIYANLENYNIDIYIELALIISCTIKAFIGMRDGNLRTYIPHASFFSS